MTNITDKQFTVMRDMVVKTMAGVDGGHSMDHIDRVVNLAMKFAEHSSTKPNMDIVKMIALLHDVDDYKLFGAASAKRLKNARSILQVSSISEQMQEKVLSGLNEIGFNKRLNGIHPSTIEAMLVSDADMCDAMGATGILRVTQYGESKGRMFFDALKFPRYDITYEQYMKTPADTTMGIIFEKLLWSKTMIITAPACKEVSKRFDDMVWFLRSYFAENGYPEWDTFLTRYVDAIFRITGDAAKSA